MSFQVVKLLKNPEKTPVDSKLHDAVSLSQVSDTVNKWKDIRYEFVLKLFGSGREKKEAPEHWHWDWAEKMKKVALSGIRVIGIECEGEWQGLAMLTHEGYRARLEPDRDKPTLYVMYIENAPWNLKAMTPSPRFSGIGVRLMQAIVRQSIKEGFEGRVGLHSLDASRSFYENAVGFTFVAVDTDIENLPYYELTRASAIKFLEGEVQ